MPQPIIRQADQYPATTDYARVAADLQPGEHLYNRDPARGHTVPQMVGGDAPGTVSVAPPGHAGPDDARIMHPEETGLEYPVLARPSAHGHGFDVIQPLG